MGFDELVVDLLDVEWVPAKEMAAILHHRRFVHLGLAMRRRLTDTVVTLIRMQFDEDPVLPRIARNVRLDVGDLHWSYLPLN